MPSRRGTANGPGQRSRTGKNYFPVVSLLVISVVTPLVFLAVRLGNFGSSLGPKDFTGVSINISGDQRKLSALEQIETLFPKEMIDMIKSKVDDSGPLSLNVVGRKDLSSSWVLEKPNDVGRGVSRAFQTLSFNEEKDDTSIQNNRGFEEQGHTMSESQVTMVMKEQLNSGGKAEGIGIEQLDIEESRSGVLSFFNQSEVDRDPEQIARRKGLMERKAKRLAELTQHDPEVEAKLEKEAIERTREIDGGVLGKYSIWRRESDENSDSLVRLMRDQLIMARVFASLAQSQNKVNLLRDLRLRIKESQHSLGEASVDTDLPRSAPEKIKSMGQTISKARAELYDCTAVTKKLRAMLQSAEEQAHVLKKQSTFLSQLAAKTIPKGIHCLSLRLTIEYNTLPENQRDFLNQGKLEEPSFFHYALFSDNVLAASVVVNSTVLNAKEPEKHIFHLVTDRLNYGAMKMWFLANPPGNATIHVENVDDFKWLNSSYCPVLRQLESAAMKEYYFKASHPTTLADGSSNLKYRNPKYLSMLNHLRFYLPQVYPKLDKILFLDDDIVVQKDLTPLWSVNLHGKVNGAVETCGHSFHRFDKYLNFSNPTIYKNFDPNACGWAYGMNIFDLQEWKKQDITGIYHKWQDKNEDRLLWKLGTLPPGLITFYNLTYPLDKSWHVLGLGYNPSVDRGEIEGAAVVHYNGNMKPWLELAMAKYKAYWMKYVKYDHPFLQQCNVN
eukprot:c20052_g1_i1 orf=350-2527(-)